MMRYEDLALKIYQGTPAGKQDAACAEIATQIRDEVKMAVAMVHAKHNADAARLVAAARGMLNSTRAPDPNPGGREVSEPNIFRLAICRKLGTECPTEIDPGDLCEDRIHSGADCGEFHGAELGWETLYPCDAEWYICASRAALIALGIPGEILNKLYSILDDAATRR